MTKSPKTLLASLLAVLAGGVAALAFLLAPSGGERRAADPDAAQVEPEPAPAARADLELVPPARIETGGEEWAEPTTVLWPVRVELELLRAAYLPAADGVPAIGSGRRARLSGRVAGRGEEGVRAEVRFVAGPNEGRVLVTDSEGRFGATDLFPGLDLVEIRGPEIHGSRREVRLRQGAETLLNVSYGMLSSVSGRVVDRAGEPVEGAEVRIDGRATRTGPDGEFHLGSVAPGRVLVEVDHPDYAALHVSEERRQVPLRGPADPSSFVFSLEPATTLTIATPGAVGGPGPTRVYLRPANSDGARRFPWHRVNPIEVDPGRPTVVGGLPAVPVVVHAFRSGASAPEELVNLREGRENTVRIRLQPAPKLTGVVTLDGRPAPGATVSLEAPDRVRANLAFLRKPTYELESEVLSYLPPASQQTTTNAEGRYFLAAWSEVAPVRFLQARGPHGRTWAGRLVRAGEERVDLALQPVELGDSTLVLDFPGRHQGLPVDVVVNGDPKDPAVVPPDEALRIEDLVGGTWSLRVTWKEDPLQEAEIEVTGATDREVHLPPGAIEGQDEERWRRAGREYPLARE